MIQRDQNGDLSILPCQPRRKKEKQEKPVKYKDWIMYRCKLEDRKIQSLQCSNNRIWGAGSYSSLFVNFVETREHKSLSGCVVGHGSQVLTIGGKMQVGMRKQIHAT